MLTPYLLSVAFSLAAANPILQRIPIQIPGQYAAPSCPTCPTPACQTCPTQTCPTRTCQACQNPHQNILQPMAVQSSNPCPCNQPTTVQNPIANLNQDALQQLILRRLLGHQGSTPVNTCSQCETQKSTPNIINNYIIIPPEYFKANETKIDKNETGRRRRKDKRRRHGRRRNQQPDTPYPCEDNDDDDIDTEYISNEQCDKENTPKSLDDVRVKNGDLINNPNPNTETIDEKNVPKGKRIQSYQREYLENKPVNSKKYNGRSREETNHLEEAIIKDFCRKNPSIPKEIARGLLNNIKHRVESQSYSNYSPYPYSPYSYSHYYNPQIHYYPQNEEYEKSASDQVKSRGSRRQGNKRGPGRRNKRPKEGTGSSDKKCENIVEMNPSVINIEKEITTTEKITATTESTMENTPKVSETQMETPDDLLEQLDKMKAKFAKLNEIETTTVSYNKHIEQYPELGKEDKVPTVYDNGVDDYYPDFRADNIEFYGSDEECINEDKKGALDSKRYVHKKPNRINNNSNKADITEKSASALNDSNESNDDSVNDESTEIRFKVPPHLEIPDFETKQINKYFQEISEKFVADDTRISEVDMKPAKVLSKDKSGRTNIETVLGHSRVFKYGYDAEAAATEPVITYYLPEESMTEDHIELPDGGTIVLAKSITDVEGWI